MALELADLLDSMGHLMFISNWRRNLPASLEPKVPLYMLKGSPL